MNKSPIFPFTPEANHYNDYGFEPQIDYFKVLEEARRHSKRSKARPLDSLHCKLQKPISKDDTKAKKRRREWWKSALLFWRRPKVDASDEHHEHRHPHARRTAALGPIYKTESGGGGASVARRTRCPSPGLLTAAEVGAEAAGLAYLSLRDLSLVDGRRVAPYATVTPASPIYLVT